MPARLQTLINATSSLLMTPTDVTGTLPLATTSASPSNTEGQVLVLVLAQLNTGTLNVKAQTAPAPGGPYTDLQNGAFAPITGTAANVQAMERGGRFFRLMLEGTAEGMVCAALVSLKKYIP